MTCLNAQGSSAKRKRCARHQFCVSSSLHPLELGRPLLHERGHSLDHVLGGDRDALQLASDHVSIMANTRGVTEVKVYDPAAVEERYGVPPRLIPDLIGLKGDTSDNIPGIPGIGEKTAALLLGQFGSLESVLEHAEEVSGAKRRELLVEHREVALMSKKLALVDRNVPIDIHAAEVAPHKVDPSAVEELFNRFEFNSLLERVRPFMAVLATEEEPAGETFVCTPEVIDGTSTDFERAVGEALDLTAIAGLAVHGWGLRVVAVLVALVSLVLGYLAVSLVVMPDVAPRAIELAQVPVTALVSSQRHYLGAGLTAGAAIMALLAAVLLMRSAGSARHTAAKYAAPAARRSAARTGDAVSERGMWDAIDEGRDPTENKIEGR